MRDNVNFLYLLALLILCISPDIYSQSAGSEKNTSQQSITNQLRKHVDILCSPVHLGRSSLTGNDIAISFYIDSIFRSLSLNPYQSDSERPHIQHFSILQTSPQQRSIAFRNKEYHYLHDFISLSNNPDTSKSYEIVFGGFGDYNTLDSLDIKGKALLILSNNLRIAGLRVGDIAKQKGCAFVMVANPWNPKQFESISRQLSEQHGSTRYNIIETKSTSTSRFFSKLNNPIPQLLVSDQFARDMLGEKPSAIWDDLKNGESLKTIPSELKLRINLHYKIDTIHTNNVIGWIPASTFKEQSIIIGAHFDHLAPQGNTWHPGADDNASGTATMIELARLFAEEVKNGYKPLRNLVFTAFTAEEIGLLGSEYYSINPLFPRDSTNILINIDMIGRMGNNKDYDNTLFIAGKNRLDIFAELLSIIKPDTSLKINHEYLEHLSLFSLSDHYHFMELGIPSYIFTTGIHKDYHAPTDTPEKLTYKDTERVIRLLFETVKHFADKPNPWEFEKQ